MRFAQRLSLAEAGDPSVLADVEAAWPRGGAVVGLSGGAGVGKSTLIASLINQCRSQGVDVGVMAVDPRARSGGALLGDRIRMVDAGGFVRSVSGDPGGLSHRIDPMLALMRTRFPLVLLETVGVGQTERDVVDVSDWSALAIQPGTGDGIQMMKGGLVEHVDALVVTKRDRGDYPIPAWIDAERFETSAIDGTGIAELADRILRLEHRADPERDRRRALTLLEREYGARARRLAERYETIDGPPWVTARRWAEATDRELRLRD